MWIDSHCHVHDPGYELDAKEELELAREAGVTKFIVVGEDVADSELAVNFADENDGCFATVGIHPHRASKEHDFAKFEELLAKPNVVAVGECGLDYYYLNSSKEDQKNIFKKQLDIAIKHDLPLSLHIRGSKDDPGDAFKDAFEILDGLKSKVSGVVHSFSAGADELMLAVDYGLCVGVNGIATFVSPQQQEIYKQIPLDLLLLETDAPFLTPLPLRGKVNSPKNIVLIGEFISKQHGVSIDKIASVTSTNAARLFKLEV